MLYVNMPCKLGEKTRFLDNSTNYANDLFFSICTGCDLDMGGKKTVRNDNRVLGLHKTLRETVAAYPPDEPTSISCELALLPVRHPRNPHLLLTETMLLSDDHYSLGE